MLVKKAFKFRIYPNREQKDALALQFGHARFVYNWGLNLRRTNYKQTGKGLSYTDTANALVLLKREDEHEWLKQADSQALQQKLKDLDRAYSNFFKKRSGYPNFKSKRGKQSIRYPQRFRIEGSKTYLPKVGWVRTVFHRLIEGEMKNLTVSKTKSGKYFISIQCVVEIDEPAYTGGQVGIDLGLVDFITTSEGESVPAPHHLRKAEQKLKRLQRQLSRKKKGSQGWQKAQLALARQSEKVANQRKDFQHKLSRRLVEVNRLIGFENLNVVGMLKNHHLAKSVQDAGWSEFVRQCEYKGGWYGCHTEKVDRFFPSSRLCNVCGEKHPSLTLSERKWVCLGCGTAHKRDENAAINILVEVQTTVGATGSNAGPKGIPLRYGESIRPAAVLPTQAVSLKPEAQLL